MPPEMWLLPDWAPFHPGRLWCHCRMVYLPMCYLYGTKFVYSGAAGASGSGGPSDPLVAELRAELYPEGADYGALPWDASRHWVAGIDNYSPVHPAMALAQTALRRVWERFGGALLRAARGAGLRCVSPPLPPPARTGLRGL